MFVWLEVCRQLYNAALEERIGAYRRQGKSLAFFDQCKELTELRASDSEYAAISVLACRSPLRSLDTAFKAFFRRVKAKQKPGFPRFRSRDRFDSFSIGRCRVYANRVIVPKLGHVKFHKYRGLAGEIADVRLCCKAGRWYVCFACDLGQAPEKRPVASAIGIDLGLTSFVTLSNGDSVDNPRYFKSGQDRLASRQQSLAKKKRGSRSRQRAKILVGRAHEHIHNQRLDFSRKLACCLFSQYDLVAFEDLNIRAMTGGNLAKSINDASWAIFIKALQLKAECAGAWAVPVDPRGTTKRCSRCGTEVAKALSERMHRCDCGLEIGRDHNAAINVLALGQGAVNSRSPATQT